MYAHVTCHLAENGHITELALDADTLRQSQVSGLSHSPLFLSCSGCGVILFGRSLSPLSDRTETKSPPPLSYLSFVLFFPPRLFKENWHGYVEVMSPFFFLSFFEIFFFQQSLTPFCACIYLKAISLVLLYLSNRFTETG